MSEAKKIFIFVNSGAGTDWQEGMALCEDGTYLAGHVSSSYGFFRHDMGLTSDWKHENYREHCPDGYELVEVKEPNSHEGVAAAYKLNQAQAAIAAAEGEGRHEAKPEASDATDC